MNQKPQNQMAQSESQICHFCYRPHDECPDKGRPELQVDIPSPPEIPVSLMYGLPLFEQVPPYCQFTARPASEICLARVQYYIRVMWTPSHKTRLLGNNVLVDPYCGTPNLAKAETFAVYKAGLRFLKPHRHRRLSYSFRGANNKLRNAQARNVNGYKLNDEINESVSAIEIFGKYGQAAKLMRNAKDAPYFPWNRRPATIVPQSLELKIEEDGVEEIKPPKVAIIKQEFCDNVIDDTSPTEGTAVM